ncbi:hypothetical protein MBLNU230_g5321t1 [Neophaeotheca triangularis]
MSGDDIHPTGPSQPTLNQAYTTPGNPASKEPAEQLQSDINSTRDTPQVDKRIPSAQTTSISEATPTSVARGIRGAPPGEETKGYTQEQMGRKQELEAMQMAAPGEDKIADSVTAEHKSGAAGGEQGLESDLDRKKREQAPMREQVEAEQQRETDVGGVLGQRGGPANPVDKNGYPNASS